MTKFFQQVFNILTAPPGNLIYHLVLVFSITIALQAALSSRRRGEPAQMKRLLLGLGVLLAGQLVLFLSSGLAWQSLADPQFYLPPLDRAVTALSLIWVIWMLVFPRPHRAADAVNGLLNLVAVILLFFSLATWRSTDPGLAFNNSVLDLGWGILCIFLSLTGLLLLLLERPAGWGIGLGFLLLHIAGYVSYLLLTGPVGDFAAPLRLAQMCAYPLLPMLTLRAVDLGSASSSTLFPARKEPFVERRRYTADPRATYSWLNLAVQDKEQDVCEAFTRAVAQTLLADLCLLFQKSPSDHELLLLGGYDLIREEKLPTDLPMQKTALPTINGAIHRSKALRIAFDEQPLPDFDSLAEILGLDKAGNLLMVPISFSNEAWGGVVLLSPYSHRVWASQDETYLSGVVERLIPLLEKTTQREEEEKAARELQNELESAQIQLKNLEVDLPLAVLTTRAERVSLKPQNDQALEDLIALQSETQQMVEQLKAENERLAAERSAPDTATQGKLFEMRSELRLALEEVAHLQNEHADLNLKNIKLEKELEMSAARPQNNPRIVNAITQELRQPLASIVGYTDLLLSETGGILGALQQSFLERIKVSLERVDTVLIGFSSHSGSEVQPIHTVNLSQVIDGSIAAAGVQLREKKVTLHMDVPEALPEVLADQDTLEQIIGSLLNNAVMASPFEGAVNLRLATEDHEGTPYLLIEITDSGGGIDPKDLQRVFSHRYRGENPVIKGVGDTGVGLTIAKTLTEALDGRIWVQNEADRGTTFSVLLPIVPADALNGDAPQ